MIFILFLEAISLFSDMKSSRMMDSVLTTDLMAISSISADSMQYLKLPPIIFLNISQVVFVSKTNGGKRHRAPKVESTAPSRVGCGPGKRRLTFSDQISSLSLSLSLSLSKSCYYHIRELRCIRPYLNFKTASTIATSIICSL